MRIFFTKAAVVGVFVFGGASVISATTGPFTSPLTSAFLSVDFNGGPITTANATTEGWNGASVVADNFGVIWSPFGGPTSTGGDGTQLPSSQSSPNVSGNSISRTYGLYTVTLSINVAQNSASYSTVNGVPSMNSRDRGSPTGALNDGDLFRDLVFAGGTGANVQSSSYLIATVGGLAPGGSYKMAAYSFDSTGAHSMNWTATAPTTELGLSGWFIPASNSFSAPADEQTITWAAGTATQAPAVFTVVADPSGNATIWGWGGNGVTGNQSSDTSYINGLQISPVPEPASMALLGFGSLALVFLRRKTR